MKLTDTQRKLLEAAAKHPKKLLTDFPATLKGGALNKVLTALSNASLIGSFKNPADDTTQYSITYRGLEAIGDAPAAPPKQRDGTKQAKLIELLNRPEGASIAEMIEATGWQQHTIRGAMAGALKKKLGLNIVSEKTDGQERKYRIA
jgi:hypothetical protein